MRISLKLVEDSKTIEKLILDAMISNISIPFKKSVDPIRNRIAKLLENAIKGEPEYGSLINGDLKFEFGIPNPEFVVNDIIKMWVNNFIVKIDDLKAKNTKIVGNIEINMIKSDFSDVLKSPSAIVYDIKSDVHLPWLQWLLIDGSKILVRKHAVKIAPSKYSRTGMAVMVESDTNWRVPAQYAGTISNNWITRAISSIESQINKIIQEEITNKI